MGKIIRLDAVKQARRRYAFEEPYPMNLMLLVNDGVFMFEPLKNEDIEQDNIDGLLYAVTLLPERTQKMIRLRYEERQTYTKIGKAMGITAERVRYLLRDAESKLRRPDLYGYILHGKLGRELRRAQLEEEKKNTAVDKMKIEVRDMGLPIRAANRLIARNCDTVADVAALSKDEIMQIKMLGAVSRHDVAEKLESMGIVDTAWKEFL